MAKYTAKSSGIYIIVNTQSGYIYIGQAQSLRKRWNEHRRDLNKGCHHNEHLQRSWNKYGEKSFKFQVLENCSLEQLNEREQHYLDVYMAKGICYNMSPDAITTRGYHHSEETRRKIGEASRNRTDETRYKLSMAHKGNKSRTGQTNSPETRRKISESNRGKIVPPEVRRKISEAHKGKPMSEVARKNMSMAMKGRVAHNKGKPMSEEHRKKLKGRIVSKESRQKISDANRKITDEQTSLIQLLICQGVTQEHIGQAFGVSQSLISLIKHKFQSR